MPVFVDLNPLYLMLKSVSWPYQMLKHLIWVWSNQWMISYHLIQYLNKKMGIICYKNLHLLINYLLPLFVKTIVEYATVGLMGGWEFLLKFPYFWLTYFRSYLPIVFLILFPLFDLNQYGLDTSEFSYNPSAEANRNQQAAQPVEEKSRCTIMWSFQRWGRRKRPDFVAKEVWISVLSFVCGVLMELLCRPVCREGLSQLPRVFCKFGCGRESRSTALTSVCSIQWNLHLTALLLYSIFSKFSCQNELDFLFLDEKYFKLMQKNRSFFYYFSG